MSDVRDGAPGELAAVSRSFVLATKLHVPRTPPGFVSRSRLVEQLDDGLARKLVLVCAPAGSGKTALLADWNGRWQRPMAWLSVDSGDNDPVRFWRHAAATLDRVRPGIADQVAPFLDQPDQSSFEDLVTELINRLADDPGDVTLVLDDYHLVEAQPVHASVSFLLEHLPPGTHLVLASRSEPPLPLARLRALGQLAELRADELRFTEDEAGALLRDAVGCDLPDEAVAALTARTEGWAAGLQLAALSLRGHPDVADSVATFSGSHRYVLDFLTMEVLERQPATVRDFLLETSILERLCGELCDAVTGRTDGQPLLEAIERANLFLIPLDEVREWWRYHHLFGDLLRSRLQIEKPDRVMGLHRNAAAWCEEHGLIDDAVRHTLAAGDYAWTARLIEENADALHLRSEGATLQRWLAAMPLELSGSWPRLSLVQARLALLRGRLASVEGLLDDAERAWACASAPADERYEPSVGRGASVYTNVPAMIAAGRALLAELRGDPEATTEFASQALAELGDGGWMLESLARAHMAVAEWLRGRLPEAERGFTDCIAGWRAAGESALVAWGCHHLGLIQCAQGRLDAALGTYHQLLEMAAPRNGPALPAAGAAYVGMSEVEYQRGQFEDALRHATDGIALCRQLTYTQPLANGLATVARIRHANGDAAGALDAIAQAERASPGPGIAELLNPVSALRARMVLADGDVTAAARWAETRGLDAEDEVRYVREPAYLVLARVLLAQHSSARAMGLIARLHDDAAAQGRIGSLIEIKVLQALAWAVEGDQTQASATLTETLTLARSQEYIRVFVDEGAAMSALLGQLIASQFRRRPGTGDGLPVDYLGQVARAFRPDFTGVHADAARPPTMTTGPVVPLSEREGQVLRLLAAGKQNREIAGELYVTLDTVKKHITHILDKLGATNRTEATARAHKLGLLD